LIGGEQLMAFVVVGQVLFQNFFGRVSKHKAANGALYLERVNPYEHTITLSDVLIQCRLVHRCMLDLESHRLKKCVVKYRFLMRAVEHERVIHARSVWCKRTLGAAASE